MGESILLIDDITVHALVLISFFDEAKVDKTNNLIFFLSSGDNSVFQIFR